EFLVFALAEQNVKAPPHAVLRHDLKTRRSPAPVAAKAKATEYWIVSQDGRGRAQCAAISQINFAGVVPGASVVRLIEPGLAVRRRLESATGAAVVLSAGIPVAKI